MPQMDNSRSKGRARKAVDGSTYIHNADENKTRYTSQPDGMLLKEKKDEDEDEGSDEPAAVSGLAEKKKPSSGRGTASRIIGALVGGLSQWSQDERANRKSNRDLNNARMKS